MVHKRKTVTDLEQRAIERKKKYVLYPVKEIMEDMNRSEASVSKHLSELEDTRLLERMQSAPGRPCKLYLKKLSYVCEV